VGLAADPGHFRKSKTTGEKMITIKHETALFAPDAGGGMWG